VIAGDLPVTATATVGGATDEIATDKIATDRFPPAHVATAGVASSDDIAIEVEGLTKSFAGKAVVRNLTMKVRRGLIYGFLGPNGSGKTTTIRMLCGLLTPDSGRGTCLGYDILTQSDQIKSRVGYMTQRFSLYQDLSVRENLEFIARIYGIRDRAAQRAPPLRGSA
jgi:ABC-2 type transport system ATP-binding protein